MNILSQSTSGRGDPYWYEWFVGLIEVVDLLDTASDAQSVAFQVEGIKGWDDVVVTLKNGAKRYYQVKHTRAENSLTFGDLVQPSEDGKSLLKSLFDSWKAIGLDDGRSRFILYTNREAGRRSSKSESGIQRPPLLNFIEWLGDAVPLVESLAELLPDESWLDAWAEWQAQLVGGTDDERLRFIRAFEIRASEDDLDGLVEQVSTKMARYFGVTQQRVAPLRQALHEALRKWTTGHAKVTVEDLCDKLAVDPEPQQLAPAPPPPVPFFPSRVPVAIDLESEIGRLDGEPVFFLTADPGAGKTSVLSWLSNRRFDKPFQGLVGLRFFCFEPIRPEAPFIAPDASRVKPSELWISLLVQLRRGLRGRLHELQVPIRDDLLTWNEARSHVLRLASQLGTELGQRFVILIDGIDHAARAAQTRPQEVAEFFASLPSPDELSSRPIRLLIAGQPAQYYANEYPTWLQGAHPGVRKIELPKLQFEDVTELYRSRPSRIPEGHEVEVVRLILDQANGNTLATVFAMAEAENSDSVEVLATRLDTRRLADGLDEYYRSIWDHSLLPAWQFRTGVDCCLVAALSLARRGVSADSLADAFHEWQSPAAWWRSLLESLGPLLTDEADGFRVRHNDVRVFLSRRFTTFTLAVRQRVTSQLADYFVSPTANRVTAHLQLFDLLNLSGRNADAARFFNVDWVMEGAAIGIDLQQLLAESAIALQALVELRDWHLAVSVACAANTLERLLETSEYDQIQFPKLPAPLPPFLPSEVGVRPVSQWSIDDLNALVHDATELIEANDRPRALGLLQRWLDGLSLSKLVSLLSNIEEPSHLPGDRQKRLDQGACHAIRGLGWLCGTLNWKFPIGCVGATLLVQAQIEFEQGFVDAVTNPPTAVDLNDLFKVHELGYLAGWQKAVRNMAHHQRWDILREALYDLAKSREDLNKSFVAEATWWSLKSKAVEDDSGWIDILNQPRFEIENLDRVNHSAREFIAPFLNVARALGWRRVDLDPGDIAERVLQSFDPNRHFEDRRAPTVLVFRAAALLGRIESAAERGGLEEVRKLVTSDNLATVCSSLWGEVVMGCPRFDHRAVAGELAEEIAEVCGRLGGDFDVAILNSALPFAAKFPIDFRQPALWSVMARHGHQDHLQNWVTHWLSEEGAVWSLSHDEVHSVVTKLAPLADQCGCHDIAQKAADRMRWLLVGYRNHKEYGFDQVFDWFKAASQIDPMVWRSAGRRLWALCDVCNSHVGDNRYEWEMREAMSAAAMRCSPGDWWALLASSLDRVNGNSWHEETQHYVVNGACSAFESGWQPTAADLPVLWSLGVSLSFWFDEGDNSSLRKFRDHLLRLASTNGGDARLLALMSRTDRSSSLDKPMPTMEKEDEPQADEFEKPVLRSIEEILDLVLANRSIKPSEAARAIEAVSQSDRTDRSQLCRSILAAIGSGDGRATDWTYVDSNVSGSLEMIARNVSVDDLWEVVRAIIREDNDDSRLWNYSIHRNLMRVVLLRAKSVGIDEIRAGLETQLHMHARWAFGGGPDAKHAWPQMLATDTAMTWRDVAIKLQKVLLSSRSAEVLGAALEGLHVLVAADPSVAVQLLAEEVDEWSRHWLLSAAESWAVLHAETLDAASPQLSRLMHDGSLHERLEAWVVLATLSKTLGRKHPQFPLPETTSSPSTDDADLPVGLLQVPSLQFGHFRMTGRHAAAEGRLRHLEACGLDFRDFEPLIARELARLNDDSIHPPERGPHRRSDLACSELDAENAVGRVISSVISEENFDQEAVPSLAQAFLGNEDAWLERSPPRRASHTPLWPNFDEYRSRDELTNSEVYQRLREIALRHDVPNGWHTFVANGIVASDNFDYVLRLWWEQASSPFILRRSQPRTCPSGRSFIWRLDTGFPTESKPIVSGHFSGGHQRLHFTHFEVQPAQSWMDLLEWKPDSSNPLSWNWRGNVVAKYDRIHGPIRNSSSGPKCRQPLVDRWIVTSDGLTQVREMLADLVPKDDFQIYPFKDE